MHHPDFDKKTTQGWRALHGEAAISGAAWKREQERGLPGADSLVDKTIPTFSRGELPHFAGINTFMKAPYAENVRDVGKYDGTVHSPRPCRNRGGCLTGWRRNGN